MKVSTGLKVVNMSINKSCAQYAGVKAHCILPEFLPELIFGNATICPILLLTLTYFLLLCLFCSIFTDIFMIIAITKALLSY